MVKNLVIVESPAKAKTIEKFLGKDFIVKSCNGHIRNLVKKNLGIDIQDNFKPTYEIDPEKKGIVSELKKLSKEAEVVWLASDEDREGEAISWHLAEVLSLKKEKIRRIAFHEITKDAILSAIENPRNIDEKLVDAQQTRRILDRLVGFELSPILWKKVKPSLSAGRVQSVAVRLIVEREMEINAFNSESSYKVIGEFKTGKSSLNAELTQKFKTKKEAEEFLKKCFDAEYKIESIDVKPSKRSPAAPFTTSTLQQEANRKMGFSVAQTMRIAQQLYESGLITYMRTDSVNLSETAIEAAKKEIFSIYGKEYSNSRRYTTKSKGAQEAHEAIRPTYMNNHTIEGDSAQKRLYELIWKRTIASQMSDAEMEKTNVNINISTWKASNFLAQGEVVKFEGFLKVYFESTDNENGETTKGLLPPMKVGEKLINERIVATERFSIHPPRYTEASLVRKLEELGIGRPSTYAPTISTIQKREYVVKEDREGIEKQYNVLILKNNSIKEEEKTEIKGKEKSKLFPTDIGTLVNEFLIKYFDNIMDYNFTASVEKEFDEIAQGDIVWNKVLDKFYSAFHKKVETTIEKSEKVTGERLLGVDPQSGENVYVRIGRYGPMAQIGNLDSKDKNVDSKDKPKFASLKKGQSVQTITLAQVLELFKLPRKIGEYENKEMTAAIGRFGPYIKHDSKFYSLKKEDDPLTITFDRAIEVIEEKRKKEREKLIKKFKEDEKVQILNGRWGPYIAIEKNNYKIPKDVDPASLTLEECYNISKNSINGKSKTKKSKGK